MDARVERFMRLFDGRRDVLGGGGGAHAMWVEDSSIEATTTRYTDHLYGKAPFGVYPLQPTAEGLSCRWGAIDVDKDDMGLVVEFVTVLTELDTHCHVEISRSKGYHVWWFYGRWVPAWVPRSVGLEAAHRIGEDNLRAVLGRDVEVYPKQFTLPSEPDPETGKPKVGNYLRLPYPNGWEQKHRQVMMDDGEFVSLDDFLQAVRFTDYQTHRSRALQSQLCPIEIALGIKIPPFPLAGVRGTSHEATAKKLWQEAAHVVFGETTILMGGRDNQLFTCSNLMWASGWDEQRATERMEQIWQNQMEQGNGKQHIPLKVALDKVRRTYAQRGINHKGHIPAYQGPQEGRHGQGGEATGGKVGAQPRHLLRQGGEAGLTASLPWRG